MNAASGRRFLVDTGAEVRGLPVIPVTALNDHWAVSKLLTSPESPCTEKRPLGLTSVYVIHSAGLTRVQINSRHSRNQLHF